MYSNLFALFGFVKRVWFVLFVWVYETCLLSKRTEQTKQTNKETHPQYCFNLQQLQLLLPELACLIIDVVDIVFSSMIKNSCVCVLHCFLPVLLFFFKLVLSFISSPLIPFDFPPLLPHSFHRPSTPSSRCMIVISSRRVWHLTAGELLTISSTALYLIPNLSTSKIKLYNVNAVVFGVASNDFSWIWLFTIQWWHRTCTEMILSSFPL